MFQWFDESHCLHSGLPVMDSSDEFVKKQVGESFALSCKASGYPTVSTTNGSLHESCSDHSLDSLKSTGRKMEPKQKSTMNLSRYQTFKLTVLDLTGVTLRTKLGKSRKSLW
jgi:hypothetical protein